MRLAFAVGASSACSRPRSASSSSSGSSRSSGDGLGHVAFAGVAAGYLLGISPVLTALCFAVVGAFAIEWLRSRGGTAGDQALALVFYTGIALGIVLVSSANRLDVGLFQFLFGSILTVTRGDLWVVLALGGRRPSRRSRSLSRPRRCRARRGGSRVAGAPVDLLNTVVAVLAALTVGISMRIVGILLIAALMVLPGDRGAADRLEPPLHARPLGCDRARLGARRAERLVLRGPAPRRDDRPARRRRVRRRVGRRRGARRPVDRSRARRLCRWPTSPPEIVFDHVTKRYPGRATPAVDDLSLTVPAGEICVLVGPSGGGKTTAMKMVNRLIDITEGDIRIGGQERPRPRRRPSSGAGSAT